MEKTTYITYNIFLSET